MQDQPRKELFELYPSFRARSGAAILDIFIVFFISVGLSRGYGGEYLRSIPFWNLYLLSSYVYLFFFYLTISSTAAKIILGMRIHNLKGTRMTFLQCFVRLTILPLSIAVFLFGYLYLITNSQRRSFHDMIAKTVVVYLHDE